MIFAATDHVWITEKLIICCALFLNGKFAQQGVEIYAAQKSMGIELEFGTEAHGLEEYKFLLVAKPR